MGARSNVRGTGARNGCPDVPLVGADLSLDDAAVPAGTRGPLPARGRGRAGIAPRGTVLDLACGTGSNFPYLQRAVGPSGHLVGFDYTPEMLAQARERVARAGWANVTLIRGDAAQLSLDAPVGGVLCTLALSVIPGWRAAIARAADVLRLGGVFAVADARLSTHPLGRLLNPVAKLMGWGAAADIGRRPWEEMTHYLEDVQCREFFLSGFFYVAWGRKPT